MSKQYVNFAVICTFLYKFVDTIYASHHILFRMVETLNIVHTFLYVSNVVLMLDMLSNSYMHVSIKFTTQLKQSSKTTYLSIARNSNPR